MDIRRCGTARYYNITLTKFTSTDLVGVCGGGEGEWVGGAQTVEMHVCTTGS